ncbi:E3 ubiquitin-protein ligase RNF43-like [Hibiscus syriacus]|uniref:E3 ubiquitin-protein ligase RNF43-like n=1 Tax=Hibiscus syriacus TaxID=106335 RepID=A0A6A3CEN7_HIBSY|nr:E3 ubiquitin-protein ligase RNF43-like [Hibiscus syriacus]
MNYLPSSHRSSDDAAVYNDQVFFAVKSPETAASNVTPPPPMKRIHRNPPSNPRIARLPPRIAVPKSDLFFFTGLPTLDLKRKPKYLASFSVGIDQLNNIDACVRKFSEDFQILLFHYDGRTNEWDRFEWSKRAIHVSVKQQTKWWYAKWFLHLDVVSSYEYIFTWDEDLGVEHFNAQSFVEITAPVFSWEAWRCVWYMIQNDLVHGWGLDFAVRRCVDPAHEKIGIVDSQWVSRQNNPLLLKQGITKYGKCRRRGNRVASADKAYHAQSRAV